MNVSDHELTKFLLFLFLQLIYRKKYLYLMGVKIGRFVNSRIYRFVFFIHFGLCARDHPSAGVRLSSSRSLRNHPVNRSRVHDYFMLNQTECPGEIMMQ
jgi:hypothetical protein